MSVLEFARQNVSEDVDFKDTKLGQLFITLALSCDGAIRRDMRGFSKSHADDGHYLESKIKNNIKLTPIEVQFCIKLVNHYQGQLRKIYGDQALDEVLPKNLNSKVEIEIPHCPYISFNEITTKVDIKIPNFDRRGTVKELFEITKHHGVMSCVYQVKDITDKAFSKGAAIKDYLSRPGISDFVNELGQYGYMIDSRVQTRLENPHKVSMVFREHNDNGRLQAIVRTFGYDPVMNERIDRLAEECGQEGAFFDKTHYHGHLFYIGDKVLPQMQDFILENNVDAEFQLTDLVKKKIWNSQLERLLDVNQREDFINGVNRPSMNI